MSSNFWTSSHCQYWLVTRSHLAQARAIDTQYATPRQLYCLGIWFCNLIQKLGKRLLLRQIPIATATVFFRRFYLKNSYCETNPYLVLAACCFVAAKVEETPVHIKSVVQEAKVVFGEVGCKMFPAETHKLGEMEFYLMEDLDFHLTVYHPYRSLLHITGREPADTGKFPQSRVDEDVEIKKREAEIRRKKEDEARKSGPPGSTKVALALDEVAFGGTTGAGKWEESEEGRIRRLMSRGTGEGLMEIDEGVLQICLFLINDTYRTDVHLLYPPYIISLAVLYIGFCLTAMNNPTGARTRSSSSQINSLVSSTETNEQLGLSPPPAGAAEFIASFDVSLPVLLACVQDIIVLYPIWEAFEPSARPGTNGVAGNSNPAGPGGSSLGAAAAALVKGYGDKKETKDKFGPEEAETLVRRMIEERAVDLSRPATTNTTAHSDDGKKSVAGSSPASRKRPRG